MAGKASVIFNADTGQYIAAVQGMDAATAKAAQTVADTKNKVLESTNQQVAALKNLGASSEDLAKVQTSASNALARVTEKNSQEIIASLDRVYQKQLAVREASKNLNIDIPQSGHGFSDRMAVSAVVREGEGTTSIRAIENVLTMFPAATAAAQVFATAIGVGGVLGIVTEIGEKGYAAFHKLETAMRDADQAAEALHDKERVAIDDKEIYNQKLQDEIDKLEGHPNNGLATALLDVKKRGDEALNTLRTLFEQEEKLFAEQKMGTFATVLNQVTHAGPEGTDQQRQELRDANNDVASKIAGYRNNLDANLSHAKTDEDRKAATQQYNEAVRAEVDSRVATLKREYARLEKQEKDSQKALSDAQDAGQEYLPSVINNGLKKRNIQTNIDDLQRFSQGQQLDQSIYDKQQQVGVLKQDKQNDQTADEAARKAAEAQRKQFADEYLKAELPVDLATGIPKEKPATPEDLYNLRVQQQQTALPENKLEAEKNTYEAYKSWLEKSTEETRRLRETAARAERQQWADQLDALKAAGPMSAQAEADYWTLAMLEAETGSQNYLEAERKANEAIARVREERQRSDEASKRAGLQGANDQAKVAEATVALEQQTGQISKYDAAVQLANIHTQQYAAQIAALKGELARQQDLDVQARREAPSAETINAQAAVDKAVADRKIQVETDAAKASAEAWKTALEQSNAQWIQNATDSAAQVRQLYSQAIDGFNDQAASAVTGGKTDWSGYARGLAKTVATDGLKHAEAPLLGALGLGKPDGSSSNPLWVRMAEGGAGAGAVGLGALGGLMKLFGKGGSDGDTASGVDGAEGTGSAVSSVADAALGGFSQAVSMGGFALGGDIAPAPQARSITVGEMGEEQLTLGPGTGAHVTPNKELGSGGGNAYYSVSVANGVTPEEFDMRMRAALSQYHPQAVRSSVQAMQDAQRRKPSTSR